MERLMSHQQFEYDVFISHASEDKDTFVREFASKLHDTGLSVWYDEFTLEVGDSLSGAIDKGLVSSKYGIIVISDHFLKKDWPEYELRGLLARQIGGKKIILPIWHNLDRKQLLNYSPTLADRIALKTDQGIDSVALQIIRIVRPDIFRAIMATYRWKLSIENAIDNALETGNFQLKKLSDYKKGPRRRQQLTDGQMRRVRITSLLLQEVESDDSFEKSYDLFLRDIPVEDEIQHWEWLALVFHQYKLHRNCSADELENLYRGIILLDFRKVVDIHNTRQGEILKAKWTNAGLDAHLLMRIIIETNLHPTLDGD
jgi:TIR domain